jgi:quercetin 2,3-dioxygenase
MKTYRNSISILLLMAITMVSNAQKAKTMKTVFHKADTRGHAYHGWLDAHHTFSFANYYDPLRIQFGALRVLNDDIVQGGRGFGQHPHDNMEIITIPLRGSLEHKDNTGGHGIIKAGEVQVMSAGTGVQHSEVNASATEEVNLLQIWVFPRQKNVQPRYDQKQFSVDGRINKWQTIVSPAKDTEALWVNQDTWFSLGKFTKGFSKEYVLNKVGHGVYAFVIEGDVTINGQKLNRRDGLGIWDIDKLTVVADNDAEVLLMEVPMK